MTYYSGKDGSLVYNGTVVAKVSNWSISATVDTLETTVLTDGDRTYVPGLRTISGSATVFYYDSAPVSLLERIIKNSAVSELDILVIKLGWGVTSNPLISTKFIQGSCIITSAELNCAVGEVMQASIQFQFTGAPSNTTTL
jgi:hypothetical protein